MGGNNLDINANQSAGSIGSRVDSTADILSAMPADAEIMAKIKADPMIHLMAHPLAQHDISLLRCKDTGMYEAHKLVRQIAIMSFYEQTRSLPMKRVNVETPITATSALKLDIEGLVLTPILRAGQAMAEAILEAMMTSATVSPIGMCRNPDDIIHPICDYDKVPNNIAEKEIFVLDPMLATGWSAAGAISRIKAHGGRKIHFMCIFSVWDGIEVLRKEHPDVDLCIGVVDFGLNEKFYIVPGAGDMGDRIYGAK